jgi:glycosyltransferase involved in cell wall biosynthesis
MADLAVIILTLNEEAQIERAINSIRNIAKEIFVVDSYSTDQTREIARSLGANVYQNKWINYSRQYQWALANLPISCGWIMRLDADEFLEPELADELEATLPRLPVSVTGLNLKYKHIFMNRWIRHGGVYPLVLLRVWRHGLAKIEDRWMDEHMVLIKGQSQTLRSNFCGHSLKDLTFFITKHNHYATREAIDIINQRRDLFGQDTLSSNSGSKQAVAKRFIKEKIYNRMPLLFNALVYFLYRYILRFGFLDGVEGAIYHFLQGYWYRFLVGAKVVEFERALQGYESKEEQLEELSRVSGHDLMNGIRVPLILVETTKN